MLPKLLFVTNPWNSGQKEDQFLANHLGSEFQVIKTDPIAATQIVTQFSRVLIRNAWPSSLFASQLKQIQTICEANQIKTYNPIHRGGWVEDKSYLAELYQKGYPVIPSFLTNETLPSSRYFLAKPLDGCSSNGILKLSKQEIADLVLDGYVIQPEINFVREISFYFIDQIFTYAMASKGRFKRWELEAYTPKEWEVEWATQFVTWNRLPWGVQRIDACQNAEGSLLLMEIEDQTPLLSLLALRPSLQKWALFRLEKSVVSALL